MAGGLTLAISAALAAAAEEQNTDPLSDPTPRHVPGSNLALTARQISGVDGVPDWRPNEHPPMPAIVAKGRPPAVYACGLCHLPNGAGRPDNAAIAGETPGYFKQQMDNFRNGDRSDAGPPDLPQNGMTRMAKAITDSEIAQAAAYFSGLPAKSFVKVTEAAMAPKTVTSSMGWLLKSPTGEMEPTRAIVEVPDDSERAENRDPDVTYTAYVPPGSLAKGRELATSETGDKTIACKECHGDDLKGDGDMVPWIAGRSPTYIYRQLSNIKNGKRAGTAVPMQMVVEKLDSDDMIAIAAYVASLKP